jgi:sodium/hydrogen antiporter
MLLNLSIFLWFGAICPWSSFASNDGIIPIYRLIFLGILILLFRRLPVVLALHKHIPQIEDMRQAVFVGFFGPVGVSAIFYLYVSLEFLETIHDGNGHQRADVEKLGRTMTIVVWFLAICSIIVHGLTIPLGKLGFHLPRTISQALSFTESENPQSFRVRAESENARGIRQRRRLDHGSGQSTPGRSGTTSDYPILSSIGGTVIRDRAADTFATSEHEEPSTPPATAANRTIRFPNEVIAP